MSNKIIFYLGLIGQLAFSLAFLFSNVMIVVLGTIGVLAVYSLIF